MIYDKIVTGTFVTRLNRFIAIVIVNGKEEKVHVKNTGRCRELLIPEVKVILEDCSHVSTRKTRYSLIGVWKQDVLVNMDSQAPNTVVYEAIKANKIPTLTQLIKLKREVSFKNSRFDLYFESAKEKGFIEVKGVTLENNGVAMFPDAPTERGVKHLLEMIQVVKQGNRGIIFFLIQMQVPRLFKPNYSTDKKFAESLILAKNSGVEILVYDSYVETNSISLGKSLPYEILEHRLPT